MLQNRNSGTCHAPHAATRATAQERQQQHQTIHAQHSRPLPAAPQPWHINTRPAGRLQQRRFRIAPAGRLQADCSEPIQKIALHLAGQAAHPLHRSTLPHPWCPGIFFSNERQRKWRGGSLAPITSNPSGCRTGQKETPKCCETDGSSRPQGEASANKK